MQTTHIVPRLTDLVELLRKATARRDRVREEVTAMSHALRVRAALTSEEQQAFDLLVVDYTETVLGMLIDRSTDDAVAAVRRHLASVALTMR